MRLSGESARYWQRYLDGLAERDVAAQRLYGAMRVGDCPATADRGASLILRGIKTATSSLLWEYQAAGTQPAARGSLSVVEDGRGQPVCVIETTEVCIKQLCEVDARFAADYGEWDGSLATWRERCLAYYRTRCRRLGKPVSERMPLVCERFRVVSL